MKTEIEKLIVGEEYQKGYDEGKTHGCGKGLFLRRQLIDTVMEFHEATKEMLDRIDDLLCAAHMGDASGAMTTIGELREKARQLTRRKAAKPEESGR